MSTEEVASTPPAVNSRSEIQAGSAARVLASWGIGCFPLTDEALAAARTIEAIHAGRSASNARGQVRPLARAVPRRIQRQRVWGWRMPPNCRYVGRPTLFGNPFRLGDKHPVYRHVMSAAECVLLYARGLEGSRAAWRGEPGSIFSPEMDVIYRAWEACTPHLTFAEIELAFDDLHGKHLCCWCKLCAQHQDGKPLGEFCPRCSPCHVDVLLVLANPELVL